MKRPKFKVGQTVMAPGYSESGMAPDYPFVIRWRGWRKRPGDKWRWLYSGQADGFYTIEHPEEVLYAQMP